MHERFLIYSMNKITCKKKKKLSLEKVDIINNNSIIVVDGEVLHMSGPVLYLCSNVVLHLWQEVLTETKENMITE